MKRITSPLPFTLFILLIIAIISTLPFSSLSIKGTIPNQAYPSAEVGTIISPQMSSRHMNQPSVFNGYAVLAGNAAHEIWDLSDPYNPSYVSQMVSEYAAGEAESHQVTYGKQGENYYLATVSGKGVDIWNITDVRNPVYEKAMVLPGINYGDVNNAVWGLSWQGHHLYVGATNHGLYVLDVSDVKNPEIVGNLSQVEVGGIKAGPVFAMGNILIVTTPKNTAGIATLDISQPDRPLLLDAVTPGGKSYIGGFYGKYAILINPLRIYDVMTDPSDIQLVAEKAIPRSEYISFDENHLFLGGLRGGTEGIYKYDLSDLKNIKQTLRIPGRDTRWDDQFSCPIGNLILLADDQRVQNQYVGGVVAVHDSLPDNDPPTIDYIFPPNNSTELPLTTRIGISFSDWPEFATVNNSTFILRKKGGDPVPGAWGCTYTTLNFSPDSPLEDNTEYEIVMAENGITDLIGNPLAATTVSTFSTGQAPGNIGNESIAPVVPVETGEVALFQVINSDSLATYVWETGDSTLVEGVESFHVYDEPGRYTVTLNIYLGNTLVDSRSFLQVVHAPLPEIAPVYSSNMLLREEEVWVLNPDAQTVSVVSTLDLQEKAEIPVGTHPIALVESPNNEIWVVNRESWNISVIDPNSKAVTQTLELPYGSQPSGILVDPVEPHVYVSLRATGELLKMDASGNIQERLSLGPDSEGIVPQLGGMALNPNSGSLYITRIISPEASAEVYQIDTKNFTRVKTISLAIDPGPDTDISGRGIPNYLHQIVISPDANRAWIPSKKDNIQRGGFRDGLELVHDNTVRAITSIVDLASNEEQLENRLDFDNVDRCHAVTFSPLGDLAFVSLPGNKGLSIFNAYNGKELDRVITGEVPDGCIVDGANGRLFVHNFLSRSLSVYDIDGLMREGTPTRSVLELDLVKEEPLSEHILRGKRLFYDANAQEINADGYMSCASCHLDGGEDGRVWDFASLGEGFRNTIDLRGKEGTKHGRLHWSANFDEVHDFENQLRTLGEGTGLLEDAQYVANEDPLANPKAGLSRDLDALAAYVTSLAQTPASPYRNPDGTMTEAGMRGKQVFVKNQCYACHGGGTFTNSPADKLHDIGTITPNSGMRIGATLEGFDTPTLRGIWANAPYLHDGSAKTLEAAIQAHQISSVDPAEMEDLVAYLLQIDDQETMAASPEICTNGIDDDGDGQIDGQDADCQQCQDLDQDQDGVCDAEDVCPGGDDRMDLNSNGLPDACECFSLQLEAEYATYSGPVVRTNHAGYTGTGFLDFSSQTGDKVEFHFEVFAGGEYEFEMGYSLQTGDRPLAVALDNELIWAAFSFPATGGWNQWGSVSLTETLAPGRHTFQLIAAGNAGPNVDYLHLQPLNQAQGGGCYQKGDITTSTSPTISLNDKWQIIPNPIRDHLKIELGKQVIQYLGASSQLNISLLSPNGQEVRRFQATPQSNIDIDLSTLRGSGVYIVKLEGRNSPALYKRIVKY